MALVWIVLCVVLIGVELHHMAFFAMFGAAGSAAAAASQSPPRRHVLVQTCVAVGVSAAGVAFVRPQVSEAFARRGPGTAIRGVHGGLIGARGMTVDEVQARRQWPRSPARRDLARSDRRRIFDTAFDSRDRHECRWHNSDGENRRRTLGAHMIALGSVTIGALVVAGLIILVLLFMLRKMVNIVQQGEVGVVKRLGEYRKTHEPGLVIIGPFIDSLQRVDMREIPVPGDRQEVITRDNVVVTVNATIFTQIVDAKQALFSVANFGIAIDALARTALRSVIGTLSLDEALSERERINTDVQSQMEAVTDKWGIRIARIEIVEITPPPKILEALALQKQADQEKRAKILQSEGNQQSAINIADGAAKAAIRGAEGERASAILRAEGNRQAYILEAQGRAEAIASVYNAIRAANPDPSLIAILQLDTLAKFAESDNTKIVVPFESAALLGAAQALRSVFDAVPNA